VTRNPRRPALALTTTAVAVLATVSLATAPAIAAPTEHISNGSFSSSTDPWWATTNVTMTNTDGQLCAEVPADTENAWDAIVGYSGLPLVKGDKYSVEFTASASVDTTIRAVAQLNVEPYTAPLTVTPALTADAETFSYDFISSIDVEDGAFQFQLGGSAEAYTFCVDDVSVASEAVVAEPTGPELVPNGTFEDAAADWFSYGTTSSGITDGQMCAVAEAGLENVWDAGLGQGNIELTEGNTYVLSFTASVSPGTTVRPVVQLGEDPYTSYFQDSVEMTDEAEDYTYTFIASEDTSLGQVAFQFGASADEVTLCVDDVSLREAEV
jgi:endoglucanase